MESETVDGLFEESLGLIRRHVRDADRVVLLLQELKVLSVKAVFGSKAASMVVKEQVSRAIVRRVRRTGRPLRIADALEDSGLSPRGSIQEIGQRSVLCVPLKDNSLVIGFIYVDSLSLVEAFSDSDMNWLGRLAIVLSRRLEMLMPAHLDELARLSEAAPVNRRKRKKNLQTFGIDLIKTVRSYPGNFQALRPNLEAIKQRPRAIERCSFFRAMSAMITAGVSIDRSLQVLSEQDSRMAKVAGSLQDDIVSGRPLSSAMSRFPSVFNRVQVSMIAVGENSGTMDTVLLALADAEERQVGTRGRAISALIYPAAVLGFVVVGCLLAPPLFLNDFFRTLADSGVSLPPLTLAVMYVSKTLWSPFFWALVAFAVVGLRVLYLRWKDSPRLALRSEELLRKVPVLGELASQVCQLAFVRSLALQLEAGLYLDKSLVLASRTSGSRLLEDKTVEIVEGLKNGASLGFSIERSRVFPRLVVEFLKMGEETGRLSQSCQFAENLLRAKLEAAIEVAEALVEPLSMALVGFLVGLVALACMLPLVKMFEAFV